MSTRIGTWYWASHGEFSRRRVFVMRKAHRNTGLSKEWFLVRTEPEGDECRTAYLHERALQEPAMPPNHEELSTIVDGLETGWRQ